MLVGYVITARWHLGWIRDFQGYVIGHDFLNSWTMGREARLSSIPSTNYDPYVYADYLKSIIGTPYMQNWSYPPHLMMVMIPFGFLPYHMALAIFLMLSAGLLIRWLFSVARDATLITLFSPASIACIWCGQMGFLMAGIQGLGLRMLKNRPIRSGLLLSLLCLKPQIGIVFPFYLLLTKQWKTLLVMGATAGAIMAVSVAILGAGPWQQYVSIALPVQRIIMEAPPYSLLISIFSDLRLLGVSFDRALTIQGVIGLLTLMVFLSNAFKQLPEEGKRLALASVAILITPYFMIYDLVFFTAATALYWYHHPVLSRWGRIWIMSSLLLPLIHYIAGTLEIPGTILIPVMLLGWLLRQPTKLTD